MQKGIAPTSVSQTCKQACVHCTIGSPGSFDTLASEIRSVKELIREDLPTLDLPMTANSGCPPVGHSFTEMLLLTKTACFTRVWLLWGRLIFNCSNAGLSLVAARHVIKLLLHFECSCLTHVNALRAPAAIPPQLLVTHKEVNARNFGDED